MSTPRPSWDGRDVYIRPHPKSLPHVGLRAGPARVEDYWDTVIGQPWRVTRGPDGLPQAVWTKQSPAVTAYVARLCLCPTLFSDRPIYIHQEGLGHLVHPMEIEGTMASLWICSCGRIHEDSGQPPPCGGHRLALPFPMVPPGFRQPGDARFS